MKFTLYLDSFCEFGQICRHSKLTHSKLLKDKDEMQPDNPAVTMKVLYFFLKKR